MVAGSLLLRLNEGGWFFRDEWDFLVDRGGGADDAGLLESHNEHWSTVPILVFRALFAVFGVRTYLPYAAALIAVHLVAAHLVWRVMRRSGAHPWVATGLIPVLLVFGPGADNLLWAFQIGFVGSLALGLAHVLLVDHEGGFDRRDVIGWMLSLLGVMTSGIGIPMTAVAGAAAFGRRGAVALIQTVVPPAAVFAVWWLSIGAEGAAEAARDGSSSLSPPSLLPAYVWTGLRSTFEGIARSGVGALALMVVVVAGVALIVARRRAPVPALACAAGALLLLTITGLGRASLGAEQASSPRYVYLTTALLLPAIAVALSHLARPVPFLWLVPALLGVVAAGSGLVELERRAEGQAAREGFVRETILAGLSADRLEGPIIGRRPDRRNAPDLQLDELLVLHQGGDLPPAPPPSVEALLQVAQGLQVRVERGAAEAAGGGAVLQAARGVDLAREGGCHVVVPAGERPRIRFSYTSPAQIGLRLEPPAETSFVMTRAGVTTGAHLVRNRLVTFAVPGVVVTLRFEPPRVLTVCGLEMPR